eukprot:3104346-Rhodomonas_salina.2
MLCHPWLCHSFNDRDLAHSDRGSCQTGRVHRSFQTPRLPRSGSACMLPPALLALVLTGAVSYTHLTLPTICSV